MPRGRRNKQRDKPYERQRPRQADAGDNNPEFIQLTGNEGDEAAGNIHEVFSSLLRTLPTREGSNFALPASALKCADDVLTMHVSDELAKKIWAGEYINLALLLNKSDANPSSTFSINESGLIEVKPKPCKSVQSIREWTDAFLIFSAIFIKKHPEKAGELLQYMSLIREAESRSTGSTAWRAYDESFRMRQAIEPMSWSKIHPDLWLRTMTLQASSLPKPASTGQAFYHSRRPTVRPYYDFNSVRGCTFKQCKYDHVCLACRGPHAQQNCNRQVDQSFQSNKPFPAYQQKISRK